MKLKGILLTIIGLLFASQVNAQSVQDTFFGVKLGSDTSEINLKSKIRDRGHFTRSTNVGVYIRIDFDHIYFGGENWQFASFYITPSTQNSPTGKFYAFEIGNRYKSNNQAIAFYESTKEILDSKYNATVLEDESDFKRIAYYGYNGITLLFSYEHPQSDGDELYYVNLSYTHDTIYKTVLQAIRDEY